MIPLKTLAAGSSLQTSTLESWVCGNYVGSTTMAQVRASQTDEREISDVTLMPGSSIVTPPYLRSAEIIPRLQRFYCKSQDLATTPGRGGTNGAVSFIAASNNTALPLFRSLAKMRAVPSAVNFWSADGTSGQLGVRAARAPRTCRGLTKTALRTSTSKAAQPAPCTARTTRRRPKSDPGQTQTATPVAGRWPQSATNAG